jgi:hypothetical protein
MALVRAAAEVRVVVGRARSTKAPPAKIGATHRAQAVVEAFE